MLFTLVPAALPSGYGESLLPLAACKLHLRVDHGDEDDLEDDLIAALRDAAIDMVEQYTSRRLAPVAGMQARFAGFGDRMRAGWGPAATVSVTGISYVDTAGASVVMADGAWRVSVDGAIQPAIGTNWPTAEGPVSVTFTAGYPDGACPAALLAGVRMMLTHLFENRGALISEGMEADVPLGVVMACRPYRDGPGL